MVLAQRQTYRSVEQDRKPKIKPTRLLIYEKGGKNIVEKNRIPSISDAGNTGWLHVKE